MDEFRITYRFTSLDQQEPPFDLAAIPEPFVRFYLEWERLFMKAAFEHWVKKSLEHEHAGRIHIDMIIIDRPPPK